MKHFTLTIFFGSFYFFAFTQPLPNPEINAVKSAGKIEIDGILDEADWINANAVSGFWTNFPADTTFAKGQTVVRMLFDDQFIYIGAQCKNPAQVLRYIASSLRRDYPFDENDAFGVVLDTYSDQTNGYGFYISAYGVQREEQIFSGATTDGTWDAKWFSAVSYDSTSWNAEMAIPFKYLRYNENLAHWNINFVRNDIASNERSSWTHVPRNFSLPNLAYHGRVAYPQKIERLKKNYSIIPSITYSASQTEKEDITTNARLSLDAKISITSALNLDVTINPDFSQAEVDQVQLNITRFELEFPEKRFFFIENSDLFSEFGITMTGTSPIRPFYSRRIGLQYNTNLGLYEQSQLLGGLRLSGKLNKNLRIGLMSVQTDAVETEAQDNSSVHIPGQNYSVLALQQKVFSRSNIGIILENRQGMKPDSISDFAFDKESYNRLVGVEYNLASPDNTWTGKAFTNFSWVNDIDKPENAHGLLLSRNTVKSSAYVGYTSASESFNPDMGFVPRRNFKNFYTEMDIKLYPKNPESKFNFIAPIGHFDIYLDSLERKTDHQLRYGFHITLKNTSYMYILGWHEHTKLTADFNPAQDDGPPLPAGSVYNYSAGSIYYQTDYRKNRFGSLWFKAGQYFNGTFAQFSINFNQKIQPWGTIGLNVDGNVIELPDPYSSNTIFAIGPKAEISFSRSLFVNTIVQYNSQNKNVGIYARLQWRFRPLSDLFIIYTNNHQTEPWLRRDQAFTAKLVYWL
ncbi:MAG TPA: DUF5916 domain-containing protein [Chryseolinea sp.]|nr:DUF5916 domain-containing protein [Chryseolinea sp.]